MGRMDYFPAFFKYRKSLGELTDEQVGRVFRAALEYGEDGTVPRLSAVEKMAFAFIMADIDVARGKYDEICEKRREAINKRWQNIADTADTNEYKSIGEIQMNTSDTKHTDIHTDIHTDTHTNNLSDGVASDDAATPARTKTAKKQFVPPTVEEVRQYCAENGYDTINPDAFVDYYEANGWKVGNQAMKDWRATVRNWARRDKERGVTVKPQNGGSFDTDEFYEAALKRSYGVIYDIAKKN